MLLQLSEEKATLLKRYEGLKAMWLEQYEQGAALRKDLRKKAILLEQSQDQMAMLSEQYEKQETVLRKELEEEKATLLEQCEQMAVLSAQYEEQGAALCKEREDKVFEQKKMAMWLKQYEQEAALRKELEGEKATLLKQYEQKSNLLKRSQEQIAMLSEWYEKQEGVLPPIFEQTRMDALHKEFEQEKVEEDLGSGGFGPPLWYKMRDDNKIEKTPDLFVGSFSRLLSTCFLIFFGRG